LPRELHAEFDLDVVRRVYKSRKIARNGERCWSDRFDRGLELGAYRLDDLARMKPSRDRTLYVVVTFDNDVATLVQRIGN